jgi:hypothetical protein
MTGSDLKSMTQNEAVDFLNSQRVETLLAMSPEDESVGMFAAVVGADKLPKLLAGDIEDLTVRIHPVPLTHSRLQNIEALSGADSVPVAVIGIQLDVSGNVTAMSASAYWPYESNLALRGMLAALLRGMQVRLSRQAKETIQGGPVAEFIN